jgi:hypothetical protein
MADVSSIVNSMKARQLAMRRQIDKRNISMKVIAADSDIPYSTLLSYFPADEQSTPALMPVSAQYMLCGAVPDDILSLLLPDGRLIVTVPDALDHDDAAKAMMAFLATKEAAHHPESEAGREIGPGEDNVLRGEFARVQSA